MNWDNTEQMALTAAAKVAVEAYRPNGLRANLFRLSKSVGIDYIEEQDIPTTARSVAMADGHYTTTLQRGNHFVRQRFSLAHEIAHVLLAPLLEVRLRNWARHDPALGLEARRIEELCDRMAAEILMPESLFSSWMNGKSWTAFALPEASEQFSVSLEAAARRFVEMRPGRPIFTRWNLNSHGVAQSVKKPIAPQVKNLRSLEFITEGGQPSREMRATYQNGGHATTTEMVRLVVGTGARSRQCIVESICHGNGQWREVYSLVYPERTAPGQAATSDSSRSLP